MAAEESRAECGSVRAEAIVGGASQPDSFALSGSQLDALLAIAIGLDAAGRAEAFCSGVFVAPGWALTARHCVEVALLESVATPSGLDGLAIARNASPESQDGPQAPMQRVLSGRLHPALDVALLEIAPGDGPVITPIPLSSETPDSSWADSSAELAGFGSGELRFALEPIVSVDEVYIVTDGRGRTGACGGDSGGPLLARGPDGQIRVLGLLSAGDSSCIGLDCAQISSPTGRPGTAPARTPSSSARIPQIAAVCPKKESAFAASPCGARLEAAEPSASRTARKPAVSAAGARTT